MTLSQLKSYLQIEHSDDDAVLTAIINGVVNQIEAITKRKLSVVSVEEEVAGGGEALIVSSLPIDKLISVTDPFGNEIDTNIFLVYRNDGLIKYIYNRKFSSGLWTVKYDAGYDEPPEAIVLASLIWATAIYGARADQTAESIGGHSYSRSEGCPKQVKDLLSPYMFSV